MQLTFKGEPNNNSEVSTLYIFEDSATDILQKLLFHSYTLYPPYADICHAHASGNIKGIILDTYKRYKRIIVYLDVSPLNVSTVNTYTDLCYMQSVYNIHNLFILPIFCTEYYFLLSLLDFDLLPANIVANIKRNTSYLTDIITDKKMRKCASFERYCKYILNVAVPDCISLSGNKLNMTELYYNKDCLCMPCRYNCRATKFEKSETYLHKYPIVPASAYLTGTNVTDSMLLSLQHMLVDDYNNFCSFLRNTSGLPEKYISWIQEIDPQ